MTGDQNPLPTRDQLVAVITAAFQADDMQGVAAALKVLAVVAPDDAELILDWIGHAAHFEASLGVSSGER